MIRGIGVDLLYINRVEKVCQKHEERFSQRLLAETERMKYNEQPELNRARWLAKRFAAKEAVLKALGTGLAQGIIFHDIVIGYDALGKPQISLFNAALQRANALDISEVLLSLSDEADQVLAFAVAQ